MGVRRTKGKIDLSLVIPAYNDALRLRIELPPLLAYLKTLPLRTEVLVSDDGGQDWEQTRDLCESLGIRFLSHPENQGKGAAVRRGMLAATGEFRIFTDADIPFEYVAIENFLRYLDHKEFHMVVGDRNLPTSTYHTEISSSRRLGSSLYAFIVGNFVAGGWYDTQCGLKGFRAAAAEDLFRVGRVKRFGFDVELFYIALQRNYDVKRLPVALRQPQIGSHVNVLRDGSRMLLDLALMLLYRRLGLYAPLSPIALPASAPRLRKAK